MEIVNEQVFLLESLISHAETANSVIGDKSLTDVNNQRTLLRTASIKLLAPLLWCSL